MNHASWIFADCGNQTIVNRYFVYRTNFSLSETQVCTLSVSAYSQYAAYVNGTFVDCGQYEDYEFHPVYDELDISAFVRIGENTLEIRQYVCGEDFSTRCKGIPAVRFAVCADAREILVSTPDCLSGEDTRFLPTSEKITGQLGFTFEYDANGQKPVLRPSVTVQKSDTLTKRPIAKLTIGDPLYGICGQQGVFTEHDATLPKSARMMSAFLSTRNILRDTSWNIQEADGAYFVYDLGNEYAGLLTFDINVPEPTEILIGFGEHLDDLRVRARIGSRNFCFRYIAHAGKNTFFYPYQRIGLRYLQFHVYSRSGSISNVGIRPTEYPLTQYPSPMRDALCQMIHAIGCRTLQLCMHEHYEDCPWREQSLYAMDSRAQMLCGYYAFREFAFPKASLQLMARSLRERDSLLELCAPGRVPVCIPGFTAVFTRSVYEYVLLSGDTAFAKEMLPVTRTIAEGFAMRIRENGLIPLYTQSEHWNFYEWRDGMDGAEKPVGMVYESPFNAFISDNFRCYAYLCRMVGDTESAQRFDALHVALNHAIHAAFYDASSKAYKTRMTDAAPRHALTQGLMLFADVVPQDCVENTANAIMQGKLIPCSVSMTIYVYEGLLKHGEYRDFIQKDIERVWGGMVRAGANTFWETEVGADDFDNAGSLCHGWSAVPIYIWGRYFAEDIYADAWNRGI